ncbi:MAG: ABC-ATPase domain-containing protein [Nitrospinaceae bacterium]|nr:ABC-ATPase domain-containing protein [Nitrospinaceae bacterium]
MNLEIPSSLREEILSLDGRGYKAYKTLQGKLFSYGPFAVKFEHVQGDSFAQPTRLSVSIGMDEAGFAPSLYSTATRRLALEDHLLRRVSYCIKANRIRVAGSGKSGEIQVQTPGQKILKRNGILVEGARLQLIMFAGLPAQGRSVLAKECLKLFATALPPIWHNSLIASSLDENSLNRAIETLEDYQALQAELGKNDWTTFVANGSNLPRSSGASDHPLSEGGIPFTAPDGMKASVELPHAGKIAGMPIPRGITLIVGGGFHGKSTLLRAIQDAVYPHLAGDGRERIATLPSAVKIRAEDGRAVRNVNLSAFMNHLPGIVSTEQFSTQSASGSTSQAVNILEAVETGAKLLLMDEDTCATNFMIRDERMQALVVKGKEPITPFLDRVEEINESLGVSVILVMGGSGDYFDPADHIIFMEEFTPRVVTEEAKRIVLENPGQRKKETTFPIPLVSERRWDFSKLNFSKGKREVQIRTTGLDTLTLGETHIDVRYVEQLTEEGQLALCGWILKRLQFFLSGNDISFIEGLRKIFSEIEQKKFAELTPYNDGLQALPRLADVMAVLNRIR